jgi:GH15 family glucan-1,4-alpha-glucosidase
VKPSPAIPPLHHGVIGNGSVLALVAPSGAMEWLCLPRFDSPTVFGRLLDQDRGGVFRFLERGVEPAGRLGYLRNTNVLRAHFTNGDAEWELLDFAPRLPDGWGVDTPIRIVRLVRPLKGTLRLQVDFDPRLDYGRSHTDLLPHSAGIQVVGQGGPLHLRTNAPVSYILGRQEFRVDSPLFFALSYGVPEEGLVLSEILREFELTVEGWRAWARSCALPLFAPELVLRSALCLKLHTYEDTGAVIAAATTSIPEAMGTERTWDYRYCWLRDAAFVVEALRRLSHLREGERFLRFLRNVAEADPLQPLYAVDGNRLLPEEKLNHWAGFGGNGHVRIGNAAIAQRQHDLMGELILCLESMLNDPRIAVEETHTFFPLVRRLVERAIELAPVPDTSIWEFRSMLRNYTFSRTMCWVAASRGAGLAARFGEAGLAREWSAHAQREQLTILERGFSPALGFFTQALDGRYPDASSLLFPTVGLLDARDPRFVSTLEAYRQMLVDNGLMLRYRNEDDFGVPQSAFTICSFWWAEALALAGRIQEAIDVFENVCRFANPLGLFSEDIDPKSGALLGNFPQAYAHVGLIHAAITIGDLLVARDGRVRAWV